MKLTLPLTPAEETKLLAKARSEGTTPERFVREAINPLLTSAPDEIGTSSASSRKMTTADADRALEELLDELPRMPSLSDKALSREVTYVVTAELSRLRKKASTGSSETLPALAR